ncbi:MAG: hypothetical protein JJLCMIEE_02388 [Acidimicrobiales bacterium]|nr:hypothetical protein [Acidimicrobiales bacterium]
MVNLPVGVDTAIGPLPHTDPVEAVEFTLAHQSRLPAVPILPRRTPRERRVAQAVVGVPGLDVADDGTLRVTGPVDVPADLRVDFGDDAFRTLRAFLQAVGPRQEPIKLQVIGPVTLGMVLVDIGVAPADAFALAIRLVHRLTCSLLDHVATGGLGARQLLFLDEPGLVGSMHPTFPLAGTDVMRMLAGVVEPLAGRAVLGLHCEGRSDWRLLLGSGVDIVSAPVGGRLETASDALARFLDGGGWVAWGAVPVDEPVGDTGEHLWRRLCELWCDLVRTGCDPTRLRTQALITPARGLESHGLSQAQRVLELARSIAGRTRDQVIGLRLSVGA